MVYVFGLLLILIIILVMKKYKKDSQTEETRAAGFWKGPLKTIFILGVLFLLLWGIVGHDFLSNWYIDRIERAISRANEIHVALEAYAKKHPKSGYPQDYDDLRSIVNQYGGSLPENSWIDFFYCSDSGKDYKMVIEVDVKRDEGCVLDMYYRFIMISPEGVTRHSKISTPSSGCISKEVDRDGRFIAYDDNTVKDTETGLMWASNDIRSCKWSSDAAEYCEHYGVGFYNDWRMPTIDELSTIFDKSKVNLHSNHLTRLINIDGDCAWSSEVDTEKKVHAIYSFKNGNKSWVSRDQVRHKECRVLPVRELKRKE